MARARKRPASAKRESAKRGTAKRSNSKRPAAARKAATATVRCPECGKTFATAQALGAHRNRAHGISGARKRPSTARKSPQVASRALKRGSAVDRDALIAAVYPNGVPARASVIEALAPWLAEADRLARLS